MPSATSNDDAHGSAPSAEVTLLGTANEAAVAPAERLDRVPTSVGRYVIVRHLGTGAMGAVYEARDPDLDRLVALKLVRGDLSEESRQRMQREALALARLSHPHVVQVHEIGRSEGHTFIAMELIPGQTMERWQRRSPRPGWREVLRLYMQAGEGLAAAHAEGLVHRDFKPTNCMVGDDGRVRVVDFGLAKGAADEVERPSLPVAGAGDEAALSLTRTGSVVGTPAYMPPEQLGGSVVGPAADQFSFCVALYEALYGERPFEGQSLGQLVYAIVHGELRPTPRDTKVPSWVRKVVVRGLALAPHDRWPSQRALLDALSDDPAARWRKRWAFGGGLVLAAGAAFGAALVMNPQAPACRSALARLEGVWDDERRETARQALLGTEVAFASDTWERVRTLLDDYAEAWLRAHDDACQATRAGEQSEALLDLRMGCLDERRLHLRATVDELTHADSTTVERAVETVRGLPRLDRCADAAALLADVRPPEDPTVAARVDELQEVLARAQAKRKAGKLRDGLSLVEPVMVEAETLGYEPLVALASLELGQLREAAGDYDAASAAYQRAYEVAVVQHMVSVAARAAGSLVWVFGNRLSRFEAAHIWGASAEPLSRAVGNDQARGDYLNTAGVVAIAEGDLGGAREHLERALVLYERVLGPEDPAVASVESNLGVVAIEQGDAVRAREHHTRALAIEERALGPRHPAVAGSLTNLGVVARMMGELPQARDYYERALAILEDVPEHPDVARLLTNLGIVDVHMGELAEARAHFERALAILEATLEPEHPLVAAAVGNLGLVASLQADHAQALAHHRRALAILEKQFGPTHAALIEPLVQIGAAQLGLGEPVRAIAELERAVSLGGEVPAIELAEARFVLARARLATGDGEQARADALLARNAYASAGEAGADDLAEVEAWLDAQGWR